MIYSLQYFIRYYATIRKDKEDKKASKQKYVT